MTHARLLLLAVLAAAQTGCYSMAKGEDLEQRVLAAEAWQEQFRASFDQERQRLSEELLAAEQSVADLQRALADAETTLQRSLADLGARVDGISQDVNSVRGRAEEGSYHDSQIRQEIELLREEIELQLAAIRGEH
ncbi:MAG: hypothetical protein H6699_07285 [Myxococcales bacterium]|nr:hypothetical protein [Myxococcales bacterium]